MKPTFAIATSSTKLRRELTAGETDMNKLKARLKSGKACLNGWLAIPSGSLRATGGVLIGRLAPRNRRRPRSAGSLRATGGVLIGWLAPSNRRRPDRPALVARARPFAATDPRPRARPAAPTVSRATLPLALSDDDVRVP